MHRTVHLLNMYITATAVKCPCGIIEPSCGDVDETESTLLGYTNLFAKM